MGSITSETGCAGGPSKADRFEGHMLIGSSNSGGGGAGSPSTPAAHRIAPRDAPSCRLASHFRTARKRRVRNCRSEFRTLPCQSEPL